jgi:serine protease Do
MFTHKFSHLKLVIIAAVAGSIILGGATGGVVGYFVATNAYSQSVSSLLLPAGRGGHPASAKNSVSGKIAPAPAAVASDDIAAMVKKVSPSVVSIIISEDVPVDQSGNIFNMGPFSFDFGNGANGNNGQDNNAPTQKQTVGGGSGFFVSSDGLIVTNRHVVEDTAATYTVQTLDGKKHEAKVLARDTAIDLALIKIDGTGYPAVTLGDSNALQIGDNVVAIGNALGEFSNTVTRGIVSGLNRSLVAGGTMEGSEEINGAIQTDAAINPGNSGGPLLTLDGEVVGVNTAVSESGQSVGFAIPINMAKRSIDSVKQYGRIIRPYLGVRYAVITPDMATQNNLPFSYGALVVRGNNPGEVAVIPGSPADKAGIVENDIILEADGTKINSDNSLGTIILNKQVGDKVNLKVYHKGDTKTVTVTLTEPAPPAAASQ